jgi:hypothetical protein
MLLHRPALPPPLLAPVELSHRTWPLIFNQPPDAGFAGSHKALIDTVDPVRTLQSRKCPARHRRDPKVYVPIQRTNT